MPTQFRSSGCRFSPTSYKYASASAEAERDWRKPIKYNRQDVLGMIHLVEYVRSEGVGRSRGEPDDDWAQQRV